MASNAWGAPNTGKSSDHGSVAGRGRAGCWIVTELFHLRMAQLTTAELSKPDYGCMYTFFQGTSGCISTVSVMQGYGGVNSWQALCLARGHDTGSRDWGIMLWALWFMVCAWLVRAAGHLFCSVVCQTAWGVCWRIQRSQAGPLGIQTKIFSWPLYIKQRCCLGYLYQFCKFWDNRYQ